VYKRQGLAMVQSIQNVPSSKPLVVLFDSGASHSLVNIKALPKGCNPARSDRVMHSTTIAGKFQTSMQVDLRRIAFPEFHRKRYVGNLRTYVFSSPCRYDMIIGRDLLHELGLKIDFKNNNMQWDDVTLAMREYPTNLGSREAIADEMFFHMLEYDIEMCDCGCDELPDDEFFNSESVESPTTTDESTTPQNAGYKSKEILESKYDGASIDEVVRRCTHLTAEQQTGLKEVLSKYSKLFSPDLGCYPHEKIHLDLKEDAVPHASRPYSVPLHHRKVFKAELDRLVKIGVLKPCGRSEWIAGTFIIPKKDGRVRWITDFRALNKCLRRKAYPKIDDIL